MVNGKGLMSILFALAIVQKITAFTAMNFSYPFLQVDVYSCITTRKGLTFLLQLFHSQSCFSVALISSPSPSHVSYLIAQTRLRGRHKKKTAMTRPTTTCQKAPKTPFQQHKPCGLQHSATTNGFPLRYGVGEYTYQVTRLFLFAITVMGLPAVNRLIFLRHC